jgi:hypothetical protein
MKTRVALCLWIGMTATFATARVDEPVRPVFDAPWTSGRDWLRQLTAQRTVSSLPQNV